MKASDFAKQLYNEVIQLTIDGQKNIQSKNLTRFLEEKIPLLEEADKEEQNVAVDFRLAHYQSQIESNTQMFASVLDYGKHALNAAMIINAGAAVALLSLVGNLASHSSPNLAPSFATPILFFSLGVVFAAMATGGAYFTQYFYTHAPQATTGKRFHIATVIFAVSSYGLFIGGLLISYAILRR